MSDSSTFDPLLNKLRTEDTKTVHISGGGAWSENFDMTGSAGISFTSDTKANILASSPTAGSFAISTDTNQLMYYDGSKWQESSPQVSVSNSNPDMGYYRYNDKKGYYDDTVTDKVLNNVVLKDSVRTDDGGIRIDFNRSPITLQLYYNNKWNDIVPFNFNPPLTHKSNNVEYEVATGNSTNLDIDGNPIFRRYEASMGAYAPSIYLSGGTF